MDKFEKIFLKFQTQQTLKGSEIDLLNSIDVIFVFKVSYDSVVSRKLECLFPR